MKEIRKIRWHVVVIEALEAETGNFVLNPGLHRKPVKCSEQRSCTFMSWPTEDKSGCVILNALKFIQFVVGETR